MSDRAVGYLGLLVIGAVLSALCGGCDGGCEPTSAESESLAVTWESVYESPGSLPRIEWHEGAELDCNHGRGWRWRGQCIDGVYFDSEDESADVVHIARWPGARLSETALAHELAHVAQWRRERTIDSGHSGSYFAAGGTAYRGEIALVGACH